MEPGSPWENGYAESFCKRTGQALLSELSQCRFGRKAANLRGRVFVPRSSP
ncbi:hypothetical protein SH467x_003701 [Pirellulaceae bacterium SH467]